MNAGGIWEKKLEKVLLWRLLSAMQVNSCGCGWKITHTQLLLHIALETKALYSVSTTDDLDPPKLNKAGLPRWRSLSCSVNFFSFFTMHYKQVHDNEFKRDWRLAMIDEDEDLACAWIKTLGIITGLDTIFRAPPPPHVILDLVIVIKDDSFFNCSIIHEAKCLANECSNLWDKALPVTQKYLYLRKIIFALVFYYNRNCNNLFIITIIHTLRNSYF